MRELLRVQPDADALLATTPEDLGIRVIFLMRERRARRPAEVSNGFEPAALANELWTNLSDIRDPYPSDKKREINELLGEAWSWAEREGYVVPVPGTNGVYGWKQLSMKALKLESADALRSLLSSNKRAREVLHPHIAKLWPRILRGELDGAVFDAFHAVEVAVRDAAALPNADIGVALMRKAFHPEQGVLTDKSGEGGERQALSDLFAGAIGTYKNPRSHRRVNLADADEAIEILMLASNLLRIVERAKT
jgi:uncharacterized protein (TIGR02391 family)